MDNLLKDSVMIDEILNTYIGKVVLINRKFPLISNLSVFENIILPATYYSSDKHIFLEDKVVEYLKRFNIHQKMHSRQNELTKFENFIVRFLQAFLSPFEKIVVINELYEFNDEEKTVIFKFIDDEKSDNILFMEYNKYSEIYYDMKYQNIGDYKSWLIQDLKI